MRDALARCKKELFTAVEKGFVNEVASQEAILKAHVGRQAYNLITFSSNVDNLNPWELSANHKLIQPETSSQPGIVEVGLENLIRNFGASVAIPLLYGSDFLKRNPRLIDDFWTFDNNVFPLRMLGIPTWFPMKAMREGIAARTRILEAMRSFHARLEKHLQGEAVDGDMSDVGQVEVDRSKAFTKHGVSCNHRGDIDFGLLWGQNANTQPLIFWLLAYIHATPGLLQAIRAEVAPFVPQQPEGHVAVDYQGLSRDCPLLKSAYLETFRLANEPSSLRYVARPVTIPDGNCTHTLAPGTFITLPHAIAQRNPALYADPAKFVPERFIETDEATGKRVARYGALKPWGIGVGMCKGRTFAEKEILGVVAAVVSLWELEPVGGGEWEVPGMRPGTGVMRPTSDVRVRARRRVVVG